MSNKKIIAISNAVIIRLLYGEHILTHLYLFCNTNMREIFKEFESISLTV